MTYVRRYTAALLILALTGAVTVLAQNESGTRPLNRQTFSEHGSWYDTSTAMYHVGYPILRSLPPLNSGMPWDILASYIYLDSIVRFDGAGMTEKRIAGWTSANDTLNGMIRYLYKVMDHDPVTFTQYRHEVDLKRGRRYAASLNGIIAAVEAAFYHIVARSPDMPALKAALYPNYILRVRVNSIDSMPTKRPYRYDTHIFRVTAMVLDTLKGQVFTGCPELSRAKRGGSSTLSVAEPCFQFEFRHGLYFNTTGTDFLDWPYPQRDPAFFVSPADSAFMMRPGQEAIVFISHDNRLIDSTFDYFNLSLDASANYNAMPVIDGKVKDINHVWSGSTFIDYAEWKRRFLAIRERILNGTF